MAALRPSPSALKLSTKLRPGIQIDIRVRPFPVAYDVRHTVLADADETIRVDLAGLSVPCGTRALDPCCYWEALRVSLLLLPHARHFALCLLWIASRIGRTFITFGQCTLKA